MPNLAGPDPAGVFGKASIAFRSDSLDLFIALFVYVVELQISNPFCRSFLASGHNLTIPCLFACRFWFYVHPVMTGRSGVRNYLKFGALATDEITFGDVMKKLGYRTAFAGKWQLSSVTLLDNCMPTSDRIASPWDFGFDTYAVYEFYDGKDSRYWQPEVMRDGEVVSTTKEVGK